MGKSIVSTCVGAEGLKFADGENSAVGDEPRPFARAIVDLLADASRRQVLGEASRRCVGQQYKFLILRAAVRNALAWGVGCEGDPKLLRLEQKVRP